MSYDDRHVVLKFSTTPTNQTKKRISKYTSPSAKILVSINDPAIRTNSKILHRLHLARVEGLDQHAAHLTPNQAKIVPDTLNPAAQLTSIPVARETRKNCTHTHARPPRHSHHPFVSRGRIFCRNEWAGFLWMTAYYSVRKCPGSMNENAFFFSPNEFFFFSFNELLIGGREYTGTLFSSC